MSLRKTAISGFVWTFSQQFGNQLIGFIVSVILARILLPEEFGLIGMIAVFIAVGNTFIDGGFTQSLIRKKDLGQEDFSTVFWFNLGASLFIYILLFFLAPYIAEFFGQNKLVSILRIYSFTFIISAFSAVQLARLTRLMDFRTQTIISIPAAFLGGAVGIFMAYSGWGVWSLVWSSLVTSTAGAIQLWFYSKWTPSLTFSKIKFKDHFNFAYKLTLSGLLEKVFSNIYLIIIGRFFSAAQVGFYTRAETMKQLPVTNISYALNKVTFPLFSTIQDDDVKLRRVYKKLMKMVVFLVTPILVFLAVIAEPFFRLLFTEKWLPAVPFFQILCVTGILYPIHAYNLNILNVKGRSDLFLKLEIIKKVIIIITIMVAVRFGLFALLYGQVFLSVLAFIINTHYTGKFIDYKTLEQAADVAPAIILATFVGGIVFLLDQVIFYNSADIVRILSSVILGFPLYLGFAFLLNFSSFFEVKKLINKR